MACRHPRIGQEIHLSCSPIKSQRESLPSVNVCLIEVCFHAYFTKLIPILTVGSTNSLVSENVQIHFHHLLQRKPHEVSRDDNNRLTVCSNSAAQFKGVLKTPPSNLISRMSLGRSCFQIPDTCACVCVFIRHSRS